jgi:lysyl-tRNA synthetase class 2
MKKFAHLKLRSELFRSIRNYFYDHGFIEVETPVKIHAPAPEEFIESVRSEDDFLRTSPELAMKVLLSEGMDRIFQIGSCFRANEFGRRHREEFTMLEFYEQGIGYREQALFTAGYIARAAREVLGTTRISYQGNPIDLEKVEFITVEEAFNRFARVSTAEAQKNDMFDELISKLSGPIFVSIEYLTPAPHQSDAL